ncbi:MAG: hypothetical protein EBS01_13040, partial [Verrucomicrobia bacterium]|nr:hypothetical protein [Verrucomicrobiota bacterium]
SSTVPPKSKRSAKKKPPILLWGFAALSLCGVAALFTAQAWLEGYLKSDAFRLKTESAIGRTLHAQATLDPLQRQGTALQSNSAKLNGLEGAFFRSASVQSPRAELDLNGLWSRKWKLTALNFQRLDVDLDAQRAPSTAPEDAPVPKPIPPWLASLLPNRTEIASIRTDRASFTGKGAGLEQTRLEAQPVEGGWSIDLANGNLRWPGLPSMELTQARLTCKSGGSGECILRSARLLFKAGGQATLTGQWSRESPAEFHAQLENLTLQPFLPQWWQARLHGALQGNLHYAQTAADLPGELTGELRLSNAKLEALPLLSQLDSFLGVPRFRQVPLKSASARIVKTASKTELKEIDLDADGLLRLRGSAVVEGGQIQGAFRLGIAASLLHWLPGAQSQIFADSKDGYVWAPFEISGSVDHPEENLSTRLAASTLNAVRGAANGVINAAEKVLPNQPKNLPEAAKGILDAAKSILPVP